MNVIKGFKAASEIDGYSIIKFAANDTVSAAAAATESAIGVTGQRGALAEQHVDVTLLGEQFVRVGSAINAGDRFMANTDGHAVPLAASGGQTVSYVGIILQTASEAGAVVRCLVSPGTLIG